MFFFFPQCGKSVHFERCVLRTGPEQFRERFVHLDWSTRGMRYEVCAIVCAMYGTRGLAVFLIGFGVLTWVSRIFMKQFVDDASSTSVCSSDLLGAKVLT